MASLTELVLSAALAAGLLGGPPQPPGVIWHANAETPGLFPPWAHADVAEPGRARVVPSPALRGDGAYAVTVLPGDEVACSGCDRAQLNGPTIHLEGDEDYTSVALYVPPSYPAAQTDDQYFHVAWQWHGPPWHGSPPLEAGVSEDATALEVSHNPYVENGDPAGPQAFNRIARIPFEKGVWQKFVWRVRWSRWSDVGFVELWHAPEGRPLRPVTFADGSRRVTGPTLAADQRGVHAKAANYRPDGVMPETTLYFDAIRTAPTFDAAAAAFGPPAG